MNYRRIFAPGATYFFTVVTYRRKPVFADPTAIDVLRSAIRRVRDVRPFTIDAMVVLPDHLHALWTLPPDDADYSTRWRLIKRQTAMMLPDTAPTTVGQKRRGERTVWQPRFWEHCIQSDDDFSDHAAYIHWNPVKHGLVETLTAWPYSSIHTWVARGWYDLEMPKADADIDPS